MADNFRVVTTARINFWTHGTVIWSNTDPWIIQVKGRNIDWFKEKFGGENWEDYVLSARKYSQEKAFEILKKRSNIRGAREEMERTLSARVANSEFYGLNDEGIEQLKQTQKIVLDAIKHPKIHLESVSFIMMIGERNE